MGSYSLAALRQQLQAECEEPYLGSGEYKALLSVPLWEALATTDVGSGRSHCSLHLSLCSFCVLPHI